MEKIILVNAVETSSQPSSSGMNEYGQIDGQQVLFCQVVLAKDKTTAITTNHPERLLKNQETVEERICERSLS